MSVDFYARFAECSHVQIYCIILLHRPLLEFLNTDIRFTVLCQLFCQAIRKKYICRTSIMYLKASSQFCCKKENGLMRQWIRKWTFSLIPLSSIGFHNYTLTTYWKHRACHKFVEVWQVQEERTNFNLRNCRLCWHEFSKLKYSSKFVSIILLNALAVSYWILTNSDHSLIEFWPIVTLGKFYKHSTHSTNSKKQYGIVVQRAQKRVSIAARSITASDLWGRCSGWQRPHSQFRSG